MAQVGPERLAQAEKVVVAYLNLKGSIPGLQLIPGDAIDRRDR